VGTFHVFVRNSRDVDLLKSVDEGGNIELGAARMRIGGVQETISVS
jgi:hypothetical protein